jgi:hypothetical protein
MLKLQTIFCCYVQASAYHDDPRKRWMMLMLMGIDDTEFAVRHDPKERKNRSIENSRMDPVSLHFVWPSTYDATRLAHTVPVEPWLNLPYVCPPPRTTNRKKKYIL